MYKLILLPLLCLWGVCVDAPKEAPQTFGHDKTSHLMSEADFVNPFFLFDK